MKAQIFGIRHLAAVVLGAALGWAACFGVDPNEGPYRCGDGQSCPVADMVCWDGVCCRPSAEPRCHGFVFDGGLCEDGGAATVYYEDLDHDGFGTDGRTHLFCAPPLIEPYAPTSGDCNDSPEHGRTAYPGGAEQCDGLDNDCDGTFDEGFPLQPFFRDQDLDGFGDPAQPVMACIVGPGLAENSADCEPTVGVAHPGGVEVCNGADDDCNGQDDDNLEGSGAACVVDGATGVCTAGTRACLSGLWQCRSTAVPSADICDGVNNNCDSRDLIDERPDCGGPNTLLVPDSGVAWRAINLQRVLNGQTTRCTRNDVGTTPETVTAMQAGGRRILRWQGTDPNTHVLYVMPSDGGTWDLRNPAAQMQMAFDFIINTDAGVPWAQHNQPVVMLCGPGGHLRYVNPSGPLNPGSRSGTVTMRIPLNGGLGWVIGSGSSDAGAVLPRVGWVEVLVQPGAGSPSPATFRIDVDSWGF